MNRISLFGSLTLALSLVCLSGCGSSDEPTIVGGPTAEIQAQLDARNTDYAKSMSASQKSNPNQ
ncbi:hypothetical protein [Planctomycetes bacterium CA13]|uniref:hypothetical protein n=1 Tax=Novipirellula herctigrandis TaxID=2527986 RepID=UPI0011B4EDFA